MSKVLFSIGSLSGGGAERVVSIWSKQLYNKGFEVGILVYGRLENEYPIQEGIKIIPIVSSYHDYAKLSYFKRVKKAREEIVNYAPDVVISFLQRNQITTMFATLGLNVKRIETVRISPWEIYKNNRVEKIFWKCCFLTCYAAVVQTNEQANYFSEYIRNKITVVPNPLAEEYISKYKTVYSDKIRFFIASGRICEQKNYPLMLEAFRIVHDQYPDIKLDIYGSGNKDSIDYIKRMIKELNLEESVTLFGKVSRIGEKYRSSDAFLMTSDYEGMPNSLAEAMASGLVCISTDCKTGPKDLIDDGVNGYLSVTGDVNSLVDVMLKVCQMNKQDAANMGSKARAKAIQACGSASSIDKLIQVLE